MQTFIGFSIISTLIIVGNSGNKIGRGMRTGNPEYD